MHNSTIMLIVNTSYNIKFSVVVDVLQIVAELLSATPNVGTTMEHMDTAESLTSAAEIPDQANIVESQSHLLLLPYTTPTTTSKAPGQAAYKQKKKPKTKSVQVSIRVKSKTKGTAYEHLQNLKIFILILYIATQTQIDTKSIGTLLDAPPL